MSYINDALNRAQREKDRRYERFDGLLSAGSQGAGLPRRRLFVLAVRNHVGFLILGVIVLLAIFLILRPDAPPPQETPAGQAIEREFQAALAAQRQGDLEGAEAYYQKVLLLAPDHVRALNNLGVLHMGRKQWEQAIALFNRAVVLKKDYVDPYYNLACLYAQKREIGESLWYLEVAAGLDSRVTTWAEMDADLEEVVASPAFKTFREGQKN
ncbi:MAG: tetratricopeptide repeat protein [Syntrophaceae bacterium]|nr:tetratricopeptide repeat protein [Syntrophaceae bacterium]